MATKIIELVELWKAPTIWMLTNFLSDDQCAHLMNLAPEKLSPSMGFDLGTGENKIVNIRTSWQTYLTLQQDEIVASIEQRLADHLDMPIENGEGLQILRYEIGQEYQSHHDYFDPGFPGSAEALKLGGQRRITVLMYLSEPESGGETMFPNIGLKVKPTKGNALFFYNLRSDGSLEADSIHCSIPVEAGEKWVATKWMRERKFG
jgi:prolyl 4-hydroxylase